MMKIAFISEDFCNGNLQRYKSMSLYTLLSTSFIIRFMHPRTLLPYENNSSIDIIIFIFNEKHLTFIKKIRNIPHLKSKIVIYFDRIDRDIYDAIKRNVSVFAIISPFPNYVTTQYRFAYKVKEIIKSEVCELFDHESKFWKIKKFLAALYETGNDGFF